MTGKAELIGEKISDSAFKGYISKHDKSPNLLSDMESGKNPNKFYKFTPDSVVLFDTKNIEGNPRVELEL